MKHGYATRKNRKPEYTVWAAMIRRCENPRSTSYPYYGARGITVCEEWRHSFVRFLADMGERPSDKHSLERIDNDQGYSPENCRWTTHRSQCWNRRSSRLITCDGETRCLAEWAEITGIHPNTIERRISVTGWSPERAIHTPVKAPKS
jgi:hypothetical protein